MARLKFTDGALKKLTASPKARLAYFDTRGSGLAIRVSGPAGRREGDQKTFGVPYRGPGGVQRWVTLRPNFPTLSLKEAEKQAIQILAKVALGEDPAADRARARATPVKKIHTMASVVAAFCDTLPNRRHPKTGRPLSSKHIANTERYLKQAVDHWGNTDIFTIDDPAVTAFLEEIAKAHQTAANRCHGSLSAMYRWAAARGMAPKGVLVRLQRVGSERRRDRVLSRAEIPIVWAAAEALGTPDHPSGYPYRALIKLLLCLGQRLGETSRMRWSDIDGDMWVIPASATKAGRSQTVPITSLAHEILFGPEVKEVKGDFVFVGRNPRRPVTAFGGMKARLDAKVAEICRAQGKPTPAKFRLHDLRRTVATQCSSLGAGRFVIERILNHADESVTSIYDLHRYDKEKREALEKWAARLRELCGLPPPDNVIELPALRVAG
jgi:integrase